ncbi:MAG: biotin/lipoyl-binding protein [Bacteroidetes bacterium]|nr:biotin/lipoyl-binding protein [Bacteroidota bacterium]
MYNVKVNNKEFRMTWESSLVTLDGNEMKFDMLEFKKGKFHILHNSGSFEAEVVSVNKEEKIFEIKVNNHLYSVSVKDRYDDLLHEMGMDTAGSRKVDDIKAPMPGMVLKVMVENGQKIQKGDALIVLEAMKMENILKAPSDATVKKIHIIKGDKVEKNQVLVNLT